MNETEKPKHQFALQLLTPYTANRTLRMKNVDAVEYVP
jgi:hypothetical protein